jgi:hypothetical protein
VLLTSFDSWNILKLDGIFCLKIVKIQILLILPMHCHTII